MAHLKGNNERLLEERRKYAEEMARKFYKNHKREGSQAGPVRTSLDLDPKKDDATRRGRSTSLEQNGGVTFEESMTAWKSVIGDTQQGAKKLYESMSGLGKSMKSSDEIQMESVETEEEPQAQAQPQQQNLKKSAPTQASGDESVKKSDSNAGNPPIEKAAEPATKSGGEASSQVLSQEKYDNDEALSNETDITNEQFVYALRKRLKEAQKAERELEEYKKRFLEASLTSEQLVIMLGKEKQVVEQLKEEIKQLTKHNVRLVEILGHVKATDNSGGKPSPRPKKAGGPINSPVKGSGNAKMW